MHGGLSAGPRGELPILGQAHLERRIPLGGDEKVQLPIVDVGGRRLLQTETECEGGFRVRSGQARAPGQPPFVVVQGVGGGLRKGWPVRVDAAIQERAGDLLVKLRREGGPCDNVVQEALRKMAEERLSGKQLCVVRAVHSCGTYRRHGGDIAPDGRFIGVGQQLPRRVELEGGLVFGPLACAGCQGAVLEGGDVLVFGDDPLERLRVLIPEQQVRPELKFLGRVEGDEMNVAERRDNLRHAVATHLPGCKLKLRGHLLVHVAQQFERG